MENPKNFALPVCILRNTRLKVLQISRVYERETV